MSQALACDIIDCSRKSDIHLVLTKNDHQTQHNVKLFSMALCGSHKHEMQDRLIAIFAHFCKPESERIFRRQGEFSVLIDGKGHRSGRKHRK